MAGPAPWCRVGPTFAYRDGKFTSNPTFAGSTLAYDGNALPRAPKVKLTPYVKVEAPLASGTVTARADYAFQDSYYYNPANDPGSRSEEHTSELQSLMSISYAVFSFKTKKTTRTKNRYSHNTYRE